MENVQVVRLPGRTRKRKPGARRRHKPLPRNDSPEYVPPQPSPEPVERYQNKEACQTAEIQKLRNIIDEHRRTIHAKELAEEGSKKEVRKLKNELGDAKAYIWKLEKEVTEMKGELAGEGLESEEEKEFLKFIKYG